MFAKDNEYLQEAAESLYVANADEIIRQQCRARADAERLQRTLERDKRLLEEKVQEQAAQLNEKDAEITKLKELLQKK